MVPLCLSLSFPLQLKKKRKEKTDNDGFSRLSELTSVSVFLSPAARIIFVSLQYTKIHY